VKLETYAREIKLNDIVNDVPTEISMT